MLIEMLKSIEVTYIRQNVFDANYFNTVKILVENVLTQQSYIE